MAGWTNLMPASLLGTQEYFWTHVFKVHRCPYNCSPSQWPFCFYRHEGEIGRRDPSTHYATPCEFYPRCRRGDDCWFAHSTLEVELHSWSFRTTYCRDMESCSAPFCFYAHDPYQLRTCMSRRALLAQHNLISPEPSSSSGTGSVPSIVTDVLRVCRYDDSEFWMYEYKVRWCPERRSHYWRNCLYAHPREFARRRDPQTHAAEMCPNVEAGRPCPRGNDCGFAHSEYEHGLHPNVFRTHMCARQNCRLVPCFHAHSAEELRHV